ncbi:MAG: hypothetical protein ACQEUG_15970 [Pseudomonadota bacterium]
MIEYYTQAEIAALEGRSFMFNGRQVTAQDLGAIRRGRQEWERKLANEQQAAKGNPGFALTRFE